MWIVETKAALRGKIPTAFHPIVLVPTMGALHPAHASLIRMARKEAGPRGVVIVSIFVNPIQFDRPQDLKSYPRTRKSDLAICLAEGADGVFLPTVNEMYEEDRSIIISESSLSEHLCGATRPGHFDGVCTVVAKLFLLTRCTAAVFGEKDFQQLAIILRMVRDLDFPVEIIPHPTIRESDGLAMSSRNARLTPEQRADAPRIWQALLEASRQPGIEGMLRTARVMIEDSTLATIEYLELVYGHDLRPLRNLSTPAILACAVKYGSVRLIDHIRTLPR